jgi:hypothetical protein
MNSILTCGNLNCSLNVLIFNSTKWPENGLIMKLTQLPGTGATAAAASCDRWVSQVDAQDIAYFRQRAADATRLAFGAAEQRVAAVHENFARLYLERAIQHEHIGGASSPGAVDPALFHSDWTSAGVPQDVPCDADSEGRDLH